MDDSYPSGPTDCVLRRTRHEFRAYPWSGTQDEGTLRFYCIHCLKVTYINLGGEDI